MGPEISLQLGVFTVRLFVAVVVFLSLSMSGASTRNPRARRLGALALLASLTMAGCGGPLARLAKHWMRSAFYF